MEQHVEIPVVGAPNLGLLNSAIVSVQRTSSTTTVIRFLSPIILTLTHGADSVAASVQEAINNARYNLAKAGQKPLNKQTVVPPGSVTITAAVFS